MIKFSEGENLSPALPDKLQQAIESYEYTNKFGEIVECFNKWKKLWYKIIMVSQMNEDEYNDFIENNEYWKYFKNKQLEDIRFLEITSWYHYTLWWVCIDRNCMSISNRNVLSFWEAASVFWEDRIWWLWHGDSITFARKIREIF